MNRGKRKSEWKQRRHIWTLDVFLSAILFIGKRFPADYNLTAVRRTRVINKKAIGKNISDCFFYRVFDLLVRFDRQIGRLTAS